MVKKRLFKNTLLRWMPDKEQNICESKLIKVIKRLKIEDFEFNWDRNSCYIEFHYKQESYRLEHSIEKAKEKGILLRNGMDCLNDLTQSLEDLSKIIERGTYRFDTWIAGMKKPSSAKEMPDYQEEFQIRYRTQGKPQYPEYNRNEEYVPVHLKSALRDFNEMEDLRRK
ncbi:hypothetical protein LRR81_12285 [Metabacillus sp. GX 13764]|uniref:hypothetical protein n=1 Tax=Metabacillus kandeliae TaxID=2900151 RepID=UPI001E4F6465|nr:hypothetical protein [Metabacillus kandeliae]MCD7035027.1 hypothetical protein [Metabacillus kandeliae]